MARVVRRRKIAVPVDALWAVISDPYHLPRWWPRTLRVENVTGEEPANRSWTQVLETKDGRGIRADYHAVDAVSGEYFAFEQQIEGTPFERFLRSAKTEISLDGADDARVVKLSVTQRLRGLSRLGSPMMKRAVGQTLAEALEGLEKVTSQPGEPS